MSGTGNGLILVVDDDPWNEKFLTSVLEPQFDIMVAYSSAEAWEALKTTAPDIVLLDVVMPESDGYDLCTAIRQDHRLHDIPVIFFTGLVNREAEARGLEVGAMDYITKPVSPAVLKLRVQNQIDLKRAKDELHRLVATDALTGLANRRRFDEVLEHESRRLARTATALSLILIDIDHFKSFNDLYGHIAGDDCLREVARVVSGVVNRAADLASRYGGEEFVCVLPETEAAGALIIADRLRSGIAGLNIPHGRSDVADHVTVSIGVATGRCRAGQSPLVLLGHADEQLYAAKHGGRDRVVAITIE
jgi:diguanylate cyclase (GGDEF)-like protein